MVFTSRVYMAGRGEVVNESMDSLPSSARVGMIKEEEEEEDGRGAGTPNEASTPPPRHRYNAWSEQALYHRADISPSTASSGVRVEGSLMSDTDFYPHVGSDGRRVRSSPGFARSSHHSDGRGSLRSSGDYDVRSSRDEESSTAGGGRDENSEMRSNAEALQFLRRQLVKEVRERKETEAMLADNEDRWRRDVSRSVAVAEEMRVLVVSQTKAYDKATSEARELRREEGRLREEKERLGRECAAAVSREQLAVSRLKELKGASRAAIKRNDTLMAQLEACRVVLSGAGREGEAVQRKQEAERAREEAVEERMRGAEAMAKVMRITADLRRMEKERDEARGQAERARGTVEAVALVERERDEAWEAVEREKQRGEEREESHRAEVAELSMLADKLRESIKTLSLSAWVGGGGQGQGDGGELATAAKRVGQLENALGEASRRAARLEREVETERLKARNAELQLEASREALSLAREELGGSFLAHEPASGHSSAFLAHEPAAAALQTMQRQETASRESLMRNEARGTPPSVESFRRYEAPSSSTLELSGSLLEGATPAGGGSGEAHSLRREIERLGEQLEEERCARSEAEAARDAALDRAARARGSPPPVELLLGADG